ncbi:DUF4886 domain-containing protein [Aquimarina sp. 2201CG1-2-11]|uniref:DUF4886 domain-containing protein n=1 Tax=Aquimarina discodermiae TaxID=3231043 RepID=UPI0034623426
MKRTLIVTLLFTFLFATTTFAQSNTSVHLTTKDTTKILFIGNSYTYYNSLPQLVKEMAKEKVPNKKVMIKMISRGGATLRYHWETGKALEAIKKESWDYVVLQEQSNLGSGIVINEQWYFDESKAFFEHARKFHTEIEKIGARTVFFMTWARKGTPSQQKYLTYAYHKIAKESNSLLAPVGFVWHKNRPKWKFDLYAPDGSHPSKYGSYLAALTIFSTIFDTNPAGISAKIDGYPLSNVGQESSTIDNLVTITPKEAKAIQSGVKKALKLIKRNDRHINIRKPDPEYKIPVLSPNQDITSENILGKWYGTTTRSRNAIGVTLDFKQRKDSLIGDIISYWPDEADTIKIKPVLLKPGKKITVDYISSDWGVKTSLNLVLTKERLLGISKAEDNNVTFYDTWKLSRDKTQNTIDLEAHAKLLDDLKKNITKLGYTEAHLHHYKQYSLLTKSTYQPAEGSLNADGYFFLRNKKIDKALELFKLAIALYPESANTYDSYAEALVAAEQTEKALEMYQKACDVAKKTKDQKLALFEKNRDALKNQIMAK